jgi:hypothetical protein
LCLRWAIFNTAVGEHRMNRCCVTNLHSLIGRTASEHAYPVYGSENTLSYAMKGHGMKRGLMSW